MDRGKGDSEGVKEQGEKKQIINRNKKGGEGGYFLKLEKPGRKEYQRGGSCYSVKLSRIYNEIKTEKYSLECII